MSAMWAEVASSWDESEHPRNPKGPGGGRFRSIADVEKANPDAMLETSESPEGIELHAISTFERGQGHASRALDDLVEYANSVGKNVYLTPEQADDEEGTLSTPQLKAWYKRHGFEKSPRKMEDYAFTHSMVHRAKPLTAAGWDESRHPREPGGTAEGGRFAAKGTVPQVGLGSAARHERAAGLAEGWTDQDKARAEENLGAFLRDADLSMRVPESAMLEILRDGEFVNQHGGDESRGLRRDAKGEAEMLGLPEGTPPSDLPKYAYFGPDTDAVNMYGPVKVVFKSDVKDRTTVTLGDSLLAGGVPSLSTAPRWETVATAEQFSPDTHLVDTDWNQALTDGTLAYAEAQIYGKLTPADIAYVEIPDEDYWEDDDPMTGMPLVSDPEQLDAVVDELERQGVRVSTYIPEGDFSGEWA